MKRTKIIFTLACMMCFSGCAKNISGDLYTEASVDEAFETYMARIVDKHEITVKESDKLGRSGAGSSLGGTGGALLGLENGGTASTLIGATVGAIGGAMVQDKVNTQKAFEYVIEVEGKSGLKTVIQKDSNFSIGQSVYLMESTSGRTRIRPRSTTASVERVTDSATEELNLAS